ncbi:MAG: isoleucine--tRNA ligase [Candidatus Aenigmarchaeota archaeon]|nr:isoleucine--tRNA ligase [Candidatus Aenigmarchaeota archaeon]
MEAKSSAYDSKEIEKQVQEFWAKNRIPQKIVRMNWKKKKFYLLDGPPYVNGTPHVGHVKTTVFKDIWGRLKYMQGFSVWFQPGFDCGGLPIESAVEKKLGIKSKGEIDQLGVDKFISECQALAKGNEHVWIDYYKQIGAWKGWLAPYLTSENYFIESGWWTIKQWFEKGMLVEGTRSGYWCTHCETVLAGIEASEAYKNLEDTSVFLKFKLKNRDEYFLVWTTTPWSLPGNVALAVHPDEMYVKIEIESDAESANTHKTKEKLILAEKRLSVIKTRYKILEKMPGKELAGIMYEPLLDTPSQKSIAPNDKAFRVYLSIPLLKKRVASKMFEKGKASGEEEFGHFVAMDSGTGIVHTAPGHGDSKFGEHYGLPSLSPIDEKGLFTKDAGKYAGIYVKKADPLIIKDLQDAGSLFYTLKITHSYPLCWRCKTPLIFRMSKQWFLKLDLIRDKIIKTNKKVRWLPEFGRERYHNTIEEAPDWAITRQRYWGIPLPVWNCKCGSRKVIGSRTELIKYSVISLPKDVDLHKNTVDKIKLKCECGQLMGREKDVMDVWFDSGITPWASLGYPHQNKQVFEKLWNVDLIDESQDQVKAWFDKLMLCGFSTFNEQPYNTVCMNGWTLDEKGEKMSKSLGNVVSEADAHKELGSDALRLYVCQDTAPWETQKFSFRTGKDAGRSLNILWNTYIYCKTYATKKSKGKLEKEDKWILSRINTTASKVTSHLENFELHMASRELVNFIVNDFSRMYIKLIRNRNDGAANFTMKYVLEKTCRLASVFCPFISEFIYTDLFGKSVHLQKWPDADKKYISGELEDDMKIVDLISEAANGARKESSIKLRWPLQALYVDGELCRGAASKLAEAIKTLCNIKKVVYGRPENEVNFAKKQFEGGAVYLDTKITEELKHESVLREIMRAVQEKRKEQKLVVSDKILLTIDLPNNLQKYFRKNEKMLKQKLGASAVKLEPVKVETGHVDLEDFSIKFHFAKKK